MLYSIDNHNDEVLSSRMNEESQIESASAARRRQIIDAAYDLLDRAGLEGLTIRAVLAETGLARRAFYECFAGKDDLVLAVFALTIKLAAEHFHAQVQGVANPMERLRRIVTAIALGRSSIDAMPGPSRRGAAMSREHLRLAESRPGDLQAALRPLIEVIARQLSDGMAAGVMRSAEPARLAAFVYNLVSTTVHAELLAQEEAATPDYAHNARLAEEIWEFCRRAIAA